MILWCFVSKYLIINLAYEPGFPPSPKNEEGTPPEMLPKSEFEFYTSTQ